MKYFYCIFLCFLLISNAHAVVDFPPNNKHIGKINNPTTSHVSFDYTDDNLAYVFPPLELEFKQSESPQNIDENRQHCQTINEILQEFPNHNDDENWKKNALETIFQYGEMFGGTGRLEYFTHLDDNLKTLQALNPDIKFQKINTKNVTIKITGGYSKIYDFPLLSYSFDGKAYKPPLDNMIYLNDNIRDTYAFDVELSVLATCSNLFQDSTNNNFFDLFIKNNFPVLSLSITYKYDAIKAETGSISLNFYDIYKYLDTIPNFTKIYGHSLSKQATIADLKKKNLIRLIGSSPTMEFILSQTFTLFINGYQSLLIDLNSYYQQMLNGPDTPSAKKARIDLYHKQYNERLNVFKNAYDIPVSKEFIIPKTVVLEGSMIINSL